jgi:hypothetical protein
VIRKRALVVIISSLLSALSLLCLPCSVCFGQTWSTLPVDLVVSMNTSSPGTALTAAIANAGTVSSDCTVGTSCTWGPPTDSSFTVGANQNACSNLGPASLNGGTTTYPAQSLNYNSIAHNDGVAGPGSIEVLTFSGAPASATSVSALVCLTLGPPAQPLIGSDWDMLSIYNSAGNFAVLQFNNSACPGLPSGFVGARIEVKPTTHSPCIALMAQQTYFFSLYWNINTGVSNLYAWTPAGTLIGNVTVTAGATGGGGLLKIYIGNNESGFNIGTTTYFQNIMLDWTQGTNPLFWTRKRRPAVMVTHLGDQLLLDGQCREALQYYKQAQKAFEELAFVSGKTNPLEYLHAIYTRLPQVGLTNGDAQEALAKIISRQ